MSKMIQVRNVPEHVHRKLKARAAAEGLSLSDYVKRGLEDEAGRPTFDEIAARARKRRSSGPSVEQIVSIIREHRDS